MKVWNTTWNTRSSKNLAWVGLLLAAFVGWSPAQEAGNAVVTFTLDFPNSDPSHYSIAVDAAGHTRYESTVKSPDGGEPENYRTEFEMSAANRERIFEWAKQAKYFAAKIDSGNKKLAFTGEKTLSYQDGQRSFSAQFNFSSAEPVRALTGLFENIQSTMEFGRKLAYFHKYQKLALDEPLKQMERQAQENQLSEIQGVTPVLQEIVDDSSVINVVRARAKELIRMAAVERAGR
jgi:hypothetical protein